MLGAGSLAIGYKLFMRALLMLLLVFLICAVPALACIWDCETIAQETQRFPGTLELITGRFPRHTPEFYRWRVADRERRLARDPKNLQLLDDLAVSYEKLGDHERAIALAKRQLRLAPNRYETQANLGTFYFHQGQFEAGKIHIQRALAINPQAHFGRERYQLALVEYRLQRSKLRPSVEEVAMMGWQVGPFGEFLPEKQRGREAVVGVLGMMRFGHFDSPVLLEALGDLLTDGSRDLDQDDLRARAYLKAAFESRETDEIKYFRASAEHADVASDDGGNFEDLEREFLGEISEAKQWYESYRQQELAWIGDGKNPEAEYSLRFASEESVAARSYAEPNRFSSWSRFLHLDLKSGYLLFVVLGSSLYVGKRLGDHWLR